MDTMDRRSFLKKGSLLTAAALTVPAGAPATRAASAAPGKTTGRIAPGIIDTDVNLFDWPFRALKYGGTRALVDKLRRHRIEEAWAGSYEALLHKNIDGVNARLAEEVERHGQGVLVPFGAVNPAWPDWEEDLRQVHEVYRMPGIRLYPSYQNYTLDHPAFAQLVRQAADRGLIVQIAVAMEDKRVHHPRVLTPDVDVRPLVGVLRQTPHANVHLVHPFGQVRGTTLKSMVEETNVLFDISNLEGMGGIGRLLAGTHWFLDTRVPVERLLFGSHMPFFPAENAVLKLFESPLSEQQLQAIMRENARRLRS